MAYHSGRLSPLDFLVITTGITIELFGIEGRMKDAFNNSDDFKRAVSLQMEQKFDTGEYIKSTLLFYFYYLCDFT